MTGRAFPASITRQVLAKQPGTALPVKLWLNPPQRAVLPVACVLLRAANIRRVQDGQQARVSTARSLSGSSVLVLSGGKRRLTPVSICSSTRGQKHRYEGTAVGTHLCSTISFGCRPDQKTRVNVGCHKRIDHFGWQDRDLSRSH